MLHLRAEISSETLEAELDKFGHGDTIGIVSLMDHTPGQRQFRDLLALRVYAMGIRGLTETQFQAEIAAQTALGDRVRTRHEAAAVAATRRYGAALASHDDTTAAQVAISAAHGAQVAEFLTPHEAAAACRAAGIAVIMSAPNLIGGGSHSANIAVRELAEARLLDIVSSDYVPAALLMAGLMLGDVWGNLAQGLATITAAPAGYAALTDHGRNAVGLGVDLIRLRRIEGTARVRGTSVCGERVA